MNPYDEILQYRDSVVGKIPHDWIDSFEALNGPVLKTPSPYPGDPSVIRQFWHTAWRQLTFKEPVDISALRSLGIIIEKSVEGQFNAT